MNHALSGSEVDYHNCLISRNHIRKLL